jgi:hypothetical protein
MACGLINLQHIKSEANVSDILSKHWGYQACWELIRPIFHFEGDTGNLFYDGLKFTMISDLRNFHDGECYHDVEVFPRWFKTYHDFRSKEFSQWGVLPRCGSTDDFYDMTGDVTNNHTRITTPINLISSMDDPYSSEPILDTTFDSSFLNNLDIACPTENDYCDSFFDDTTSRIIYHSFLDSCLEYNISAMLLTFMTVSLNLVI